MLKIALIQLDITVEAKHINNKRAQGFIKKAAQEACDVAVLPELFNTGFSKNIVALADEEEGEVAAALRNRYTGPGEELVQEVEEQH